MSESSMPLVSICLPNLNTRPFLEPRMESILAQTVTDWELIICDSFSDDGAWEYFQTFKNDPRIKLFQVPREGLFAGWNECLKHVTGRYVYIATSDDTVYPAFLARLTGVMEQQPDVGVAISQFDFIDAKGSIIAPTQGLPGAFFGEWQSRVHRRNGWVDFLVHTELGTSWTSITSALFRASLVQQVGPFRMDVARGEAFADRFWAMKTATLSDTVYVPERLATWRYHGNQASSFEKPGWRLRNLRMTAETIDECIFRIPEAWRLDPAWRDKLLWGMRQYYLQEFGLDRACLRNAPVNFIRGAARAFRDEPAYLMRRMLHGVSWRDETYMDSTAYLRKLMRDWNVPWPPVSLEGGP